MKIIVVICTVLLAFISCDTESKKNPLKGKWQIIHIQDDNVSKEDLFDLNYKFDPAKDTTKAHLNFINDSTYVISNLISDEDETNYYEWKGDTLFTNREREGYLIKGPENKDTMVLYNREEELSLTLVKN
jgi:hypothetical protein